MSKQTKSVSGVPHPVVGRQPDSGWGTEAIVDCGLTIDDCKSVPHPARQPSGPAKRDGAPVQAANRWTALVLLALAGMLSGCYRSSPPEVPEFHPPPKQVAEYAPTPEIGEDTSVAMDGKPPPEREPEEAAETTVAPATAAPSSTPQPKESPAQGPTIIGTWRMIEMTRNGQLHPMPDGMEFLFTFAEDGTVSTSRSGGGMPESQTMQGTYTFTGDQITLSMEGETKTGTCTFDGNDRLTLDTDEGRITLTRS